MGEGSVVVGAVGKPFGVRGEVYVHPDPDLGHEFAAGTRYVAQGGALTVERARTHGGRLVVKFEEVADRAGAEGLRGTVLSLDKDEIALDDGAVWLDEVLGAEVVDGDGALIGVLEGVLDAPAHDLLVVARPDGGEVLVPAVDEFVELGRERIVVRAIPGLLGDDEA